MTTLLAPFPWYGGKRRWADAVNARLGDVDIYVEPFAGSLAVLLRRDPARREIVCDKDAMICNFWRAVRAAPDEVGYWAAAPTYHHELTARRTWLVRQIASGLPDRVEDDVDYCDARAAGYWAWCVSSWIGGVSDMLAASDGRPHVNNKGGGQGVQVQREQIPHVNSNIGGRGVQVQRVQRPRLHDWMHALSQRLERVVVLNRDWRAALTDTLLMQTPTAYAVDVGIFLDPPYLTALRDADLYGVEDGDNPALDSWVWAVEHGDRHRIAYACHLGDFDPPDGWRVETISMAAGNRDRAVKKEGCMLYSPACLVEGDDLQGSLW